MHGAEQELNIPLKYVIPREAQVNHHFEITIYLTQISAQFLTEIR